MENKTIYCISFFWGSKIERTLLLNATFEPLKVIPWERAVTLLFQEKAELVGNYQRLIKSQKADMYVPAVIRLKKSINTYRFMQNVIFSRKTIFVRDRHKCQYCGHIFQPKDLTLDHIVPVCQGGATTWENLGKILEIVY